MCNSPNICSWKISELPLVHGKMERLYLVRNERCSKHLFMEILRAPWVMELDYVINRLGESLLATEVNLHRESRLFSIHVKKKG
jgi:hypothetical protein